MRSTTQFLIGIDEVGRGSLAGPVVVCAATMERAAVRKHLRGIRDSKQLTPQKRDEWFALARELRAKKILRYTIASSSCAVIDEFGMTVSVKRAINRSLAGLRVEPNTARVLLDGGLRAPQSYPFQTTIIKGDEKEPIIALASIIAKVTRDRRMVRIARRFPKYGFSTHKGYGTARHLSALWRNGACVIHRHSFLKNIRRGLQSTEHVVSSKKIV